MPSNNQRTNILESFLSVAKAHREKTAILTEGRHAVSYGQLLSKSNRIAQTLINAGVREGDVVGIGISKSAEYIASMLGIWASGAAFVPLDPTLPKERAQFIINQSSMRAVLVKTGKTKKNPNSEQSSTSPVAGLGAEMFGVDDDWTDDFELDKQIRLDKRDSTSLTLGKQTAFESRCTIPSDRLAYIIYTSGSTGRPKGVMVPHAGLVNLLKEQIAAFKLDENSRSLFYLSTNFDASVSDIGTALLAGSTLCIEPQGLLQSGPHFMQLLSDRNITHMDIPPSVLKTLTYEDAPKSLETIIIGGEVCAPDTVRRWAKICRVVNVYGPTEATVCTSLGVCDPETWERPLIGQPIANVNYYLMDEARNRVPIGTPGELYIGGIPIALGYVDEPELTARKFVTLSSVSEVEVNPSESSELQLPGGHDSQRLYRTGDLVMQCPDGEYQFLGRVDRQFKLRGMLVEPEEIESKLKLHPDIRLSAVLKRPLRTGFPGEKLIAFLQARNGATLDTVELKNYLLKSLPPWMVPQIFEIVESMPMTITGKVDLSALRDRVLSRLPAIEPTGALTRTQSILIDVWKRVLGLDSVGVHDDFYALGGDSLNIVEAVLASHIEGLTISPDMFAQHATIAELSEAIDHVGSQTESQSSNMLTSEFLRQDVKLDPKFFDTEKSCRNIEGAASSSDLHPLQTVFMTGSTGFLGAGLLFELLRKTEAKFYCLVRASNRTGAIDRIQHALLTHGLTLTEADKERIVPVLGDLNKHHFGLATENWHQLISEIDTVFHSAATVNMVKDYYELKPVNVDGTREVARLCINGRPKHLHYASTLSVFVATNRNTGIALESNNLDEPFEIYGGYAQTKFAAELLLREVEKHGVPISYYRYGLLTGDSTTGRSAKDDFLNLFVRGISTLGCVPQSHTDVRVDITPVDYAIKATAQIVVSNSINNSSGTYHIANDEGLSLSVLVNAIKKFGFAVDSLPPKDFLSTLKTKASKLNASESAACLALCRTLDDDNSFAQFRTMDLFQATNIRFDCTNAKRALSATSIKCPRPTEELILKYLAAQFGDAAFN
jgi:amino acid adenylation domain-containing protein/thioester reductase-like protein